MAFLNPDQMLGVARSMLQASPLPAGADKAQLLNYLPGISRAIAQAFAVWQRGASLTNVVINGAIASGGKLSGPALEPLVKAMAPPGQTALNNAIAAAVHNQMRLFESQVTVPGLPWYPAFAAYPAPVAPPMPNVPAPFVTVVGRAITAWRSDALKSAITQRFGNPKPAGGDEVARAVAMGLDHAVLQWLGTAVVKNVLGSGQVPQFRPPAMPAGPVIGGIGNMAPGGLS